MNCPNCETSIISEQQFCRSCGASLVTATPRRFSPQSIGLLMLMMMFGGVLISLTGAMLEVRWLTFAGIFVMIGGMFGIAAFSMLRRSRPQKLATRPLKQPDSLSPADTTNKLPPIGADDFFPSVTEQTTNLLEPVAPEQTVRRT